MRFSIALILILKLGLRPNFFSFSPTSLHHQCCFAALILQRGVLEEHMLLRSICSSPKYVKGLRPFTYFVLPSSHHQCGYAALIMLVGATNKVLRTLLVAEQPYGCEHL